jgi:hypothetical protein
MAVEASRWEASGPNKRATLMKHLLKKESWTTARSLTELRQKAARQRNNTTGNKELLTLAPGDACRWENVEVDEDDDG